MPLGSFYVDLLLGMGAYPCFVYPVRLPWRKLSGYQLHIILDWGSGFLSSQLAGLGCSLMQTLYMLPQSL